MGITIDDMKAELMSVEEAFKQLEPTEGLSSIAFETDGSDDVEVDYPDEWNENLDAKSPGLELTTATITIHGVTRQMTKDAALEVTSLLDITKNYALKTPGSLISDHVNYWLSHGAGVQKHPKQLKVLASDASVVAFTNSSKAAYSNTAMLEQAIEAVRAKYGSNTELLIDPKFHHEVRKTNIRLIIPEALHYMKDSAQAVAEGTQADPWYGGIHIANSLIGETPTVEEGFLFRWWCKNGSTTTMTLSSRHKRRQGEDVAEVYAWAGEYATEILAGLEAEMVAVNKLTKMPLKGELGETLNHLFDHWKVPADSRQPVQDNLVESDDLTAYGLLNAITATANAEGLGWKQVEDIMRIGGDLPHAIEARCEACHRFA